MISKSIRILALTIAFCFVLSSFVIGLSQTSSAISNFGTISVIRTRSYICGNYNSTHYYALNNVTGTYELISTDAVQTISYALNKLTVGRTWQEAVTLEGNFSIAQTITLSVGNVLLNCSQATLNLQADTALLDIHPPNTISLNDTVLGGHWIGLSTGANDAAILIRDCTNVTIDGMNAQGFNGNTGGINGDIICGYGSSYITIQNCQTNDTDYPINFINSGYNKVINCHFSNMNNGIFVSDSCGYNQISGCEFSTWHLHGLGHAIYLDGSGTSIGHNIVSGCKFHDPLGYAGVVIKCQSNSIHDNTFWNFPSGASPLSIFSQYSPCTANDNDCYNNTMTDCVWAVVLGNINDLSPTLRNKFHNNTFTRCSIGFFLNAGDPDPQPCSDTRIYYNTFISCTDIFPLSPSSPSNIVNTIIAYNTFDATVPSADVTALKSYVNTMITGNSPWLVDYNPVYDTSSPYYIPPP